jgi:RND family efflux transporter MFP subunit
MSNKARSTILRRVLYYAVSVAVCLVLVAAAAGALYWIYNTEPTAEREGATRKSAALVETMTVKRGTFEPAINVLGNVQPANEIRLSPLVGGEVIAVDPRFVPGGIIDKNQPLLEIDPADYRNVVTLRRSDVQQAEAELAIEEGRRVVARKELEQLGEEMSPENKALVLREPQIASIRARLDSARAMLEQAELDLQRTRVVAPFKGQIMEQLANIGTRLNAGEPVARLVGVETYWVYAAVPIRHLDMLRFADDDEAGSPATLAMPTVWNTGQTRTGEIARLIGELDPEARLAQVLITVDDPLSLKSDGPRLLLDTIVQVKLKGKPIDNVVRLPRAYLRQNDSVWVYDDGVLAIRPVTIAYANAEHVYVSEGLNDGDEVVTTALATVVEGRPLRRATDDDQPQAGEGAP